MSFDSATEACARALLELYRARVKPFLAEHRTADGNALDTAAELLEGALGRDDELKIGFLGESQVGKSSLINAFLSTLALPAGGIGPLTAQATRVYFSDENHFAVTYHGRQQLNNLAFALAAYLRRRGGKPSEQTDNIAAVETGGDPSAEELTSDEKIRRLSSEVDDPEETSGARRSELGDYMLTQAASIVGADVQTREQQPELVLKAIRACVAKDGSALAEELASFAGRINDVRALLGNDERVVESDFRSASEFFKTLRERAAGWRSPLIRSLRLGLRSDTLKGVSLVDLPGVGVVDDPAARVAEEFVTKEGDALIIVFRQNGVTDSIAALLEKTGVITKLLFGGSDGEPPIRLMLAVTHLDDVARSRFAQLRIEARESGIAAPDRHELYRTLSAEMKGRLREQVKRALFQSRAFDDLQDDERGRRESVVRDLVDAMQVFCVAAPDFLNLALGFDDDSCFLRDLEATEIPEFKRQIAHHAALSASRRRNAIEQFEKALREGVQAHLAAVIRQYEEGRGLAMQRVEHFRAELTKAADPLRQQMAAFHGEAVGALREGLRSEIENICLKAEASALRKLRRLSEHGRSLPFPSLRAALVRGGTWAMRDIDYPEAITLAMVDSIATQWEPVIIENVRGRVKLLADRDLKLVQLLFDAAREIDPEITANSPVEELKSVLRANSRAAVAWTKEQLDELRKRVQDSLRTIVATPIERACDRAMRAGRHQGTGAKLRIITTFEEGGEEAIGEAREEAQRLLRERYNALLRKLNDGFLRENSDPLGAALSMLTGEESARAEKADARRKQQILAIARELESLLARAGHHQAA